MANKGDKDEYKISLIGLKVLRDPNAILIFKYIEALDKEQCGGEIDGKGYSNVPSNVGPAADPGCRAATPRRRENKCLIIDTARSRVY